MADSTESLSRVAADLVLGAVLHVLSVTLMKEPAQVPGSGSRVVFEKAARSRRTIGLNRS